MANFPSLRRVESPFRELTRIQRQMDRLFDEVGTAWSEVPNFSPACDVTESNHHYVLTFDLPGVKKEDIKIDLINDELCISGERKEERDEKSRGYFQAERYYGSFSRSFHVPHGTKSDQIETEYRDGVLRIAIPKSEASRSQRISIGESKPGFFQKLLGMKKEESERGKAGERVA